VFSSCARAITTLTRSESHGEVCAGGGCGYSSLLVSLSTTAMCICMYAHIRRYDTSTRAYTRTPGPRCHTTDRAQRRVVDTTPGAVELRGYARPTASQTKKKSSHKSQSHTRARSSRSQRHLKGSKPCVAKRHRLGGL